MNAKPDKKLFENIVGQSAAKRKLTHFIDKHRESHYIPNLLFVAPKGNGKTTLAVETAKGLLVYDDKGNPVINPETGKPKKKAFVEVNCSTLKSVKQFINGLVVPFIQDKDCTVLFDEASEIPHSIAMALLTIMNINPTRKTSFSIEEYTCDFDWTRQTFLLATSEVHNIFHALEDRCERIDLEDYTLEEMGQIVQKGTPDIKFVDDVLLDIGSVLRGNARSAQKMADHILGAAGKAKTFGPKQWEELKAIFGIVPLGLNANELLALKFIAEQPNGISLTALSARTGMTRESLQKNIELYLQKQGLITILTTGRQVTAKGLEYLKALAKRGVASRRRSHAKA